MSTDTSKQPATRVCVTGATGYIASHLIKALLEKGYQVRGTVRDLGNAEKTKHLHEFAASSEGGLELVEADLMRPQDWDGVLEGCPYVFHTATSVRFGSKDPQRDIIDPAVKGTEHVQDAIARVGGVTRLIYTSSIAAIMGDDLPEDHVFTEADWNESARPEDPYVYAKTVAERAAWKRFEAQKGAAGYELVVINPGYVLGPIHAPQHVRSSPSLITRLLSGKMPMCPRLSLSLVDVRDVAEAHVQAMVRPEASGRYLVMNESRWMMELALMLRQHFPQFRLPRREGPNFLMWMAAFFDPSLSVSYFRKNLGKKRIGQSARAQGELGIHFRPTEETVVDTTTSMIGLGMVS